MKRLGDVWLRVLVLAGLLLLLPACGSGPDGQPRGSGGVQVVLEGVRVRQYAKDRLRFEFDAPRVVLDEQNQVIRAGRGVRGKIEGPVRKEPEP